MLEQTTLVSPDEWNRTCLHPYVWGSWCRRGFKASWKSWKHTAVEESCKSSVTNVNCDGPWAVESSWSCSTEMFAGNRTTGQFAMDLQLDFSCVYGGNFHACWLEVCNAKVFNSGMESKPVRKRDGLCTTAAGRPLWVWCWLGNETWHFGRQNGIQRWSTGRCYCAFGCFRRRQFGRYLWSGSSHWISQVWIDGTWRLCALHPPDQRSEAKHVHTGESKLCDVVSANACRDYGRDHSPSSIPRNTRRSRRRNSYRWRGCNSNRIPW